jgi:hypothetical protein
MVRKMKTVKIFFGTLLGVAVLSSCGDGTGTETLTQADLVGTWDALEFVFTSVENPSESVDLIELGAEAQIMVSAEGDYSLVATIPGMNYEVSTGTIIVEGDLVVITDDAEPGEELDFEAGLTGAMLTLDMVAGFAEFDIDDDGTEERAAIRLVLQRQGGSTVGNLAGSWEATEFRFVSEPGQADTVDVIDGGGSMTLTIEADGSYTAAVAIPDQLPATESGTMLIEGRRMVLIASVGQPMELTFFWLGNTLELEADSEFDFDDDGLDDDALMEVVLER